MWQQIKKTFMFVQVLAVAMASLIYYRSGNLGAALLAGLVIEVCSLLGTLWGERLRRKITAQLDTVPLRRL